MYSHSGKRFQTLNVGNNYLLEFCIKDFPRNNIYNLGKGRGHFLDEKEMGAVVSRGATGVWKGYSEPGITFFKITTWKEGG